MSETTKARRPVRSGGCPCAACQRAREAWDRGMRTCDRCGAEIPKDKSLCEGCDAYLESRYGGDAKGGGGDRVAD